MNKERRKALSILSETVSQAMGELESFKEEEEEYLENMPEGLKNGEKGERAQEAIESMENAGYKLQDAIDEIDSAIE